MHSHHYIPNRVVILQDDRILCAVCADMDHLMLAELTNADAYGRSAAKRAGETFTPTPGAIRREFLTDAPHAHCDICGQEC